jgi:hypothetical protein
MCGYGNQGVGESTMASFEYTEIDAPGLFALGRFKVNPCRPIESADEQRPAAP